MRIEIDIPDEKAVGLSKNGSEELKRISRQHIEEILDEASRLEATRNTLDNPPEVTALIINDANDYIKKFKTKKSSSRRLIWAQLVAFISTIMTAGFFKPEKFTDLGPLVTFLVAFLIAIFANVYIFLNDSKNE